MPFDPVGTHAPFCDCLDAIPSGEEVLSFPRCERISGRPRLRIFLVSLFFSSIVYTVYSQVDACATKDGVGPELGAAETEMVQPATDNRGCVSRPKSPLTGFSKPGDSERFLQGILSVEPIICVEDGFCRASVVRRDHLPAVLVLIKVDPKAAHNQVERRDTRVGGLDGSQHALKQCEGVWYVSLLKEDVYPAEAGDPSQESLVSPASDEFGPFLVAPR